MELFNIEPIASVIMLGMIAGVVELIKRLFKKDWRAVAIIAGAGLTGTLVALPLEVAPLIGAVVGFASSGFITIAQNIGKDVA